MTILNILQKIARNRKDQPPPFPLGRIAKIPESDDTVENEQEERYYFSAGEKTDTICWIVYKNANGATSERRITIKKLKNSSAGNVSIAAFCHERNAYREFRLDRIDELIDYGTGEVLDTEKKITDYVLSKAEGESQTRQAIRKHRDAINILTYLSRCDGNQHWSEVEVIINYLTVKCFFENIDGAELEEFIKRLYPTKTVFFASIDSLCEKGEVDQLMPYAVRLIEADGIVTGEENDTLTSITES